MQNKSEAARKNFYVLVGVILFCLTLVSIGASYKVYLESFSDWPLPVARLFAFLVTLGIEVAFAALIYGLMKALLGGEVPIAAIGAGILLIVMCANFIVHSKMASHQPLESWQVEYRDWIGKVVPFFTIALLIVLTWISPESKERRQERKMDYMAKDRALNYKEEYLESPELDADLENMKPMIADGVRHHIAKSLPPAPSVASASTRQDRIGFDQPSPNSHNKAMDYMRQRWFSGKSNDGNF